MLRPLTIAAALLLLTTTARADDTTDAIAAASAWLSPLTTGDAATITTPISTGISSGVKGCTKSLRTGTATSSKQHARLVKCLASIWNAGLPTIASATWTKTSPAEIALWFSKRAAASARSLPTDTIFVMTTRATGTVVQRGVMLWVGVAPDHTILGIWLQEFEARS